MIKLLGSRGATAVMGLFMLALGSSVLALRGKVRTLDEGLQLTDSVANLSQTLRAPLVKDLRDLTQREACAPGFIDEVAGSFGAGRPFMTFLAGALGLPF